MTESPRPPSPEHQAPRRPYRPPALIEYGSISSRTLAMATGSFVDSTSMLMTLPCY